MYESVFVCRIECMSENAYECVLMQEVHRSCKILEDITARDDDDDCGARMM